MVYEIKSVERRFLINGFVSAFEFIWNDRYVFSGENHDFWEVVFVTDGEVDVTEDEKVYVLKSGDMILHAPGEFHTIRSRKGSSPKGYIISFSASGELPPTLKEGIFSIEEGEKAFYLDVFSKINLFILADRNNEHVGQEASELLAAFLIRLGSSPTSHHLNLSPAAKEYCAVVSRMTEAVCENVSLEDIANRNGISVSYVKFLFRKYAGVSPKAYYTNLRVQYAQKLLCEGMSVSSVSDKMNFSSPNYFSTFYKKHTGVLPGEVKRMNRQERE